MNRNWFYVLVAGIMEIGWVSGLKHSTNFIEWMLTIVAIVLSFWLLIIASSKLPVGTVYAVFTGIGTAGTVTAEMLLFGEPFQFIKILLILLLLAGVIGLKLITKDSTEPEGGHE
ncbi:DMT family transporter [Bacillus velezensis]|jgi:paired small multidrug resistance pump|uniref:DMT family transporter n=1 Tax=Bacillus TaxID=1386 RepID=UPI0014283E47|nr:multidrug efflux SMR transporter [Bacillus velezensis]MEC1701541.1 multidrug efflux SMR transporter [Bacillus velezensis]QIR31818.1 Multidrug resistance protein YkkC [Bacillus velezensis]